MKTLTIQECIDATCEAAATFFTSVESWERHAPFSEVYGMQQRDPAWCAEQAEHHMVEALHFRGHGNLVRMRYHLLQWRLCREALRAIERERAGRLG